MGNEIIHPAAPHLKTDVCLQIIASKESDNEPIKDIGKKYNMCSKER